MKKHQVFIGVDVSKNKFDVCVIEAEKYEVLYRAFYENTRKGIEQMRRQLLKLKPDESSWLFCIEHTGVYTMPLCYSLTEYKLDYALVSGLQIHRSLGLKRGKSDKADARDIARYACLHEPELQLYQLPEKHLVKLRLLLSHRERLLKAKKMFASAEEECSEFMDKSVSKEVLKDSRLIMKQFDKRIALINRQIQLVIDSDEKLKTTYQLATSIPGVGQQITCYLIVYTRCFSSCENARQLACYAGVAPFEYSSGTSIRGRTKVSQLANKKLKSLLNMGALTAKKMDPEMALYYERKTKEGKNGMLVMNAIRNKLVARIFATVKRGTPYVPLMQFSS